MYYEIKYGSKLKKKTKKKIPANIKFKIEPLHKMT